jgi:hypothetical protein
MKRPWLILAILGPAACENAETGPGEPPPPPAEAVVVPAVPPRPVFPAMTLRDAVDLPYLKRVELSPAAAASVLAEIQPRERECAAPAIIAAADGDDLYALAICERAFTRGSTVGGELFTMLAVSGDSASVLAISDPRTDPADAHWVGVTDAELVRMPGEVCAVVTVTNVIRSAPMFLCAPRASDRVAWRE